MQLAGVCGKPGFAASTNPVLDSAVPLQTFAQIPAKAGYYGTAPGYATPVRPA